MKIRKEVRKFYDVHKGPHGTEIVVMKKKVWEAMIEAQLKGYNLTKKEKDDKTNN